MSQFRQLAAIMFTDVVGYTALMGSDEQKAFTILNKNRALQKPVIEQFNGRWIKELGDGVMASFNTVADAVYAAIEIQEACNAEDFQLRVGIHLGDVLFENDDVFGDGVNIASRIQAIAKPGCIYISESVHLNVSNKIDIHTKFIKEEMLKNVKEPVKIYEVLLKNEAIAIIEKKMNDTIQNSIAVLPFTNMSSDLEQEYFSDGISEEIINMLAQVPGLKVAGRTSSFSFKGKDLDLRLIGEQLNVNHVLEGSVRKSGKKLRITAQLIKVADGFHLWSDKFDKEVADVFDIQDEISLAILNAIKIKLFGAEKKVILKRYTNNPEAYQLYLQGRFHYNKWTGADGYNKAIEYYNEALKIEPLYVLAYTGLAACYLNLWFFSHLPAEQSLPKMKETTLRSLELDDKLAESHLSLARMKFWYEWDFSGAEQEFIRAIELNSNYAEAHEQYGMMLALLTKRDEALENAGTAIMLDPFSLMINWGAGWINWMLGNYNRSIELGKKLIEFEPHFFGGHLILGSTYLFMGKYVDAVAEIKIVTELNYGSFTLFHLGLVFGMMGEKEKAKDTLDNLLDLRKKQPVGNYDLALVYAVLGENNEAIYYLEKSLYDKEGMMVFLRLHSQLIPSFKSDPRLNDIIKKIGF